MLGGGVNIGDATYAVGHPLGLVGSLVPAVVVCVVLGLFQYGAMAVCASTIQQQVEDEMRGRIRSKLSVDARNIPEP